jgi:hypothetical protein
MLFMAAAALLWGPVPAHADEPVTLAVQSIGIPAGTTLVSSNLYVVPAGKRLVLEHASCFAYAPTGSNLARCRVGGFIGVDLVTSDAGPLGTWRAFVASQPVRFYLNANETLRVSVSRGGSTGTVFVDATVVGRLESLPD